HHRYTTSDIDRLLRLRTSCGAKDFITTEKDMINLGALADRLQPLQVARLGLLLDAPQEALSTLFSTLERRAAYRFEPVSTSPYEKRTRRGRDVRKFHLATQKSPKPADRLVRIIEHSSKLSITVLGDLIADEFIYGEISRVSREAPVLILRHRERSVVPGGAG